MERVEVKDFEREMVRSMAAWMIVRRGERERVDGKRDQKKKRKEEKQKTGVEGINNNNKKKNPRTRRLSPSRLFIDKAGRVAKCGRTQSRHC